MPTRVVSHVKGFIFVEWSLVMRLRLIFLLWEIVLLFYRDRQKQM